MNRLKNVFNASAGFGALLLTFSVAMQASTPPGWILAGSKPASYEVGIDPQTPYENHGSAYLKSVVQEIDGFGTLMQSFRAEKYAGKRVRFSAFVKQDAVQDWAGLWMRVDSGPKMGVAFDNMQNRAIKGTGGWQNYQVVLDVPQDATGIAFGILLNKTGTVWLSDAKFEVVGTDVPVTQVSGTLPNEPVNLDFER